MGRVGDSDRPASSKFAPKIARPAHPGSAQQLERYRAPTSATRIHQVEREQTAWPVPDFPSAGGPMSLPLLGLDMAKDTYQVTLLVEHQRRRRSFSNQPE